MRRSGAARGRGVVEAPRLWTQGQAVELEAGFAPSVRESLAALGHDITVVSNVAGGMNGVQIDLDTGLMTGAACWRADGSPASLAGGHADVEARFNPLV